MDTENSSLFPLMYHTNQFFPRKQYEGIFRLRCIQQGTNKLWTPLLDVYVYSGEIWPTGKIARELLDAHGPP